MAKGPVYAGPLLKHQYIDKNKVMTITTKIKKEVEDSIEINPPLYLKCRYSDSYHYISETGDLITVRGNQVTLWDASTPVTAEQIIAAVQSSYSCTESEYKEALDRALFKIEEAYTGVTA